MNKEIKRLDVVGALSLHLSLDLCHLVINGARLSDHCIKMQNHAYLKCKVNKTFDLSPIFSVGFKL